MSDTNVLNSHQEQVIMTIQLVCFVGSTLLDRMFQFDLVFNAIKSEEKMFLKKYFLLFKAKTTLVDSPQHCLSAGLRSEW